MVNYQQLDNAKPGLFDDAASGFGSLKKAIDGRLDSIEGSQASLKDAWCSQGGTSAVNSIRTKYDKLSDAMDDLGKIKNALTDLADSVKKAKDDLEQGKQLAKDINASITEAGTVLSAYGFGATSAAETKKIQKAQELIDDALTKATEADDDASQKLNGIQPPLDAMLNSLFENGDISIGAIDLHLQYGKFNTKWLANAGIALTFASAGTKQWLTDRYNPELNNWQRGGRAAYATVVTGGMATVSGVVGGAAGAGTGAGLGAMTLNPAVVAGGAIAGAYAGSTLGQYQGEKSGQAITDATIDWLPFW